MAVRKLISLGNEAVPHLERLFTLTFDAKAPIQSDASALIKRLGCAAVPFLLSKLSSNDAEYRARSVNLLMECGFRRSSPTKLVEQVLEPRNSELPDWGCDPDIVIDRIQGLLVDLDIRVRFAAASALEKFGRHNEEVTAVFVDVVQNGTDHATNWAALRLGRIGSAADSACEALQNADAANSKYTTLAIENAIGRIGCA